MNTKELKEKILAYANGKLVSISENRIIYNTKESRSKEFASSGLYNAIYDITKFLPNDIPVQNRIKCILSDVTEIPKCPICGKDRRFNLSLKSSDSCFESTCGDLHCKAVYISSFKKHQTSEFKENASKWMKRHKTEILKIYNDFISEYSDDLFEKLDITHIKEYVKNKIENRVKNSAVIKESDFAAGTDRIILLNIISCTADIFKLPKTITSRRDFKFDERIYCILHDISEIPKCKFCHANNTKFINVNRGYAESCPDCASDKYRNTLDFPVSDEIKSYIDIKKYEIIKFPKHTTSEDLVLKCKTCGNIIRYRLINGRGRDIKDRKWCSVCYPTEFTSRGENEILAFVRSIYDGKILHADRSVIAPLELDIYIPEKKLAIEYDGLYYHKDDVVKPGYHVFKTRQCENAGIKLIHIFENEWLNKPDIVKSRLKNILGIHDRTIFARKCEIKQVDPVSERYFTEQNHIQGHVNSQIAIGLYYENKLVALMTFGKCRFDKKHEWEMLRFCCKIGYHIPGGAGKLLTYFEKTYKPSSIVSYADRRWSQGKLYTTLGFEFKYNSRINYWYFNNFRNPILLSRLNFQKHKLEKKLEFFDPEKSEYENMKANGYFRIFDCGNMVFVKKYRKDPE